MPGPTFELGQNYELGQSEYIMAPGARLFTENGKLVESMAGVKEFFSNPIMDLLLGVAIAEADWALVRKKGPAKSYFSKWKDPRYSAIAGLVVVAFLAGRSLVK